MKKNLFSLKKSSLFADIADESIEKLCDCLSIREMKLERGSFVFQAGDKVQFVYFILSGSMHIVDEDFWGNRAIIETMTENTLFGEAYVFSSRESHIISVLAAENSIVLRIDPAHLFNACQNGCSCHTQIIRNTLRITSEKIVRLTEKLRHVIRRTTREKLLSYLSKCALREKSSSFSIPYSRQQLADYLCVDRSALSHELSKLQENGILKYRKNQFELLVAHDEIFM